MNQVRSATVPAPQQSAAPDFFEPRAYRNAIDRLSLAYRSRTPVVALLVEGEEAPRYIRRRFMESLDDDPVLIRVPGPCANVTDLMRQVIQGVGFEAHSLGLPDLDSVFRLFLAFQREHDRRTILFVEQVDSNSRWVAEKLADLIGIEEQGKFGLLTVLCGTPRLGELLNKAAFGEPLDRPVKRIPVAPFTLDDTREYVRRRVDSAGTTRVDQLFSYEAIPVLQEISGGVPDIVSRVTTRSIELAEAAGVDLITPEQIARAHGSLTPRPAVSEVDADSETIHLDACQLPEARLLVTIDDRTINELAIGQGHVLIGRSRLCDVQVPGKCVSRQHALIVFPPEGGVTLLDLASTNGTYVDGYSIREHPLEPGETIRIGDCRIEFLAETTPRHHG